MEREDMNAIDILEALRAHEAQVMVDDGDLVIRRDAGPLPDDLLAELRTHKPELLEFLTANACDEPLSDPAMEARRQRVLAMLDNNPGIKRAILTDTEADPESVIVTIGLRDQATAELAIPKARYDPFLILRLVEDQYQEAS
jgi:TubC N-terminal docking domain